MKKLHYLIRINIIHKLIVALIFLVLCLTAVAVVGVDFDKKIEIKKAAIIKIMKQGRFNAYIQKDRIFCAAFLNDFTEQKGIEHVKPILEVDDYNDPKLQAYFKQCPNNKFNETILFGARAAEEMEKKENILGRKLTEREQEEFGGLKFYATKNFKLFKVNLDNSTTNDNKLVLYAEGYRNPIKERYMDEYTYGGYKIIDLQSCKTRGYWPTRDPFDYNRQQPIENYNGIIKYKGAYYVFDLREETGRRLSLRKYNKNIGNTLSVCEYMLKK